MGEAKIISKLEPVTAKKYKIYINEQFAFILYKGELLRYGVIEGQQITEDTFRKIQGEVLKRAKRYCLRLLSARMYTEKQIFSKLQANGYQADIIELVLDYVKAFGYLNDENYIEQYVWSKHKSKSGNEIRAGLISKGISENMINDYLEKEDCIQDDRTAIAIILKKRRYNVDMMTEEEKRKMYAYLVRKGFRYGDIRRILQLSE